MDKFAERVIEFNEKILKYPRPERGLLNHELLDHAAACLREEVEEFEEATYHGDYIGAIDALIDLMYFAIGALHKMGLTSDQMAECGRIVHEANMTKRRGVVERRANGSPDATKPKGWVPPEESIGNYLEGPL